MATRFLVLRAVAFVACVLVATPVFAQPAPTTPPATQPANTQAPAPRSEGSALTDSARTRLSVQIGDKSEVAGLPDYVNTVYQYMLGVVTIIAIIMVIYGAFLFLLSHGEAKKAADGQRVIKDAIGGMAVLFLAYFILYNVNPRTTRLDLLVTPIRETALTPCVQNQDCPNGQFCFQGPSARTCMDSPFRQPGDQGVTCAATSECPNGLRCGANGRCEEVRGYYLCTDSTQCVNGQTCVPRTKICCADQTCRSIRGLCAEGDVCPAGTSCFPNKQVCRLTVRACTSQAQCSAGEMCVAGECRPPVRPGALPEVNAQNTGPVGPNDPPIPPNSRGEFETCLQNQDCRQGLICTRISTRSVCARPA